MNKQQSESAAERRFRMPRPPARVAAGAAAAVAIASFAFLVFGPLADQRAFALAGLNRAGADVVAPASATRGGTAASAAPQRLARASGRGFGVMLGIGAVPP